MQRPNKTEISKNENEKSNILIFQNALIQCIERIGTALVCMSKILSKVAETQQIK